jgi:hypothetical protein
MILKKSAITLCSRGGLFPDNVFPTLSPITSPPRTHRQSCEQRHVHSRYLRQTRQYATVHSDDASPSKSPSKEGNPLQDDPTQWPSCVNPSPYDVFGQRQNAPYNKARFFELVKLYHPDRHQHNRSDGLSQPTKLERYRLVIAANDILSSPSKRRLYDLYGTGWGDKGDLRTLNKAWRHEPGNASMNATWEDWERWYSEQRDGKKQEPVFMSNGGFAALIGLVVIIAAWGQATRAESHGVRLLDAVEEKHGGIQREMWKKQTAAASLTRDGRIENFLRSRDGWGYDGRNGSQ